MWIALCVDYVHFDCSVCKLHVGSSVGGLCTCGQICVWTVCIFLVYVDYMHVSTSGGGLCVFEYLCVSTKCIWIALCMRVSLVFKPLCWDVML